MSLLWLRWVTYFVRQLLVALDIAYLQTIAFILVIAVLVQVVELVLRKLSYALYQALGVYLPLITTNCAVLGATILNVDSGYNLVESVVNGFARPSVLRWPLCSFPAFAKRWK